MFSGIGREYFPFRFLSFVWLKLTQFPPSLLPPFALFPPFPPSIFSFIHVVAIGPIAPQ